MKGRRKERPLSDSKNVLDFEWEGMVVVTKSYVINKSHQILHFTIYKTFLNYKRKKIVREKMLSEKELMNRKNFYDKKILHMINKNVPTFGKKQMEEEKTDGVKLSLSTKLPGPLSFLFFLKIMFLNNLVTQHPKMK